MCHIEPKLVKWPTHPSAAIKRVGVPMVSTLELDVDVDAENIDKR